MASIKELADISNAIYDYSSKNVPGWTLSDVSDDLIKLGFKAGVYKKGNEIIIAYSGSDDIMDWIGNVALLHKSATNQTKFAISYYNEIKKRYNKIAIMGRSFLDALSNNSAKSNYSFLLTGHSLGGCLAEIVGSIFYEKVVTFNSPGALGLTVNYINWSKLEMKASVTRPPNAFSDIQSYLIYGDVASELGFHVGSEYWAEAEDLTGNEEFMEKVKKIHSIEQWCSPKRYDGKGNYLRPKMDNDFGYPTAMA